MSDRTSGSVRTGTQVTDPVAPGTSPAPGDGAAERGTGQPASATQSIPTGTNRVVQPGQAAGKPAGKSADRVADKPAAKAPDKPAAKAPDKTAAKPADRPTDQVAPSPPRQPAVRGGKPTKATGPAAPAATAGAPASAGRKVGAAGRGPRRARLQLRHIDTWSAFKISFVLSIALFFIWMVAVGVLYGVLGGLGVFNTLNELFGQLSSASGSGGGGGEVITPGIVFGAAAVIGAVNIILLTALATVATFIYNLCSDLVGGLEVTLSERD